MDFIGTKFNTPKGGILTVVGKIKGSNGKSKYQLECSICSKDTELFPELFTSVKSHLVNGGCSCGCSKNPRWTKEQYKILIIRKIKDKYKFRGFVGEFKGSKSKVKLYCPKCVHEWEPKVEHVGLYGCPSCTGNARYSPETATIKIMEIIKDKYQFNGFVGEWNGTNNTNVKLYCPKCVHEWEPVFNNVVNQGSGCPSCVRLQYTPETAKDKILEVIKDKYEFRGFVRQWNGVLKTRVRLYCHTCVHEWAPVFNSVVNLSSGCPCCANYGYQISKPGKLYVIKYTTKSNKTFLKYGITNREVYQRSNEHVRTSGTNGEILHVYECEDGNVPLLIEREIDALRNEVGYVETSKEEFPDGYTETLDVRYEKDVLAIIQKYVQDVPEYEERLCA